eukprot:5252752-Pleurochrysis_carterae.AAC.1
MQAGYLLLRSAVFLFRQPSSNTAAPQACASCALRQPCVTSARDRRAGGQRLSPLSSRAFVNEIAQPVRRKTTCASMGGETRVRGRGQWPPPPVLARQRCALRLQAKQPCALTRCSPATRAKQLRPFAFGSLCGAPASIPPGFSRCAPLFSHPLSSVLRHSMRASKRH